MGDGASLDLDPALQELVERVQQARAVRGTLCIRGGDTKAFYGDGPRGEPLDMGALCGISSYEPTELVVTVRAGTKLAELEATLAEQGQCLAFEPPRFESPTNVGVRGGSVGGMVAAGLSGPSRAAAGAVRDHVLGVTLLNGKGELLSFAAITDEPPPEVAATGHDRCVVPIKPENVDAWLFPDPKDLAASYAVLDDRQRPYYEHRMAA